MSHFLDNTAILTMTKQPTEAVNHPEHYGGDTVYETIKVLKAWLTPEQFAGFLLGNVVKYLSRAGKKNNEVEDLKKARWYLDYLVKETMNGDTPSQSA